SARTDTRHLPGPGRVPALLNDVIDDVVSASGVAAYTRGHIIQIQSVPRAIRNVVISARAVAADPETAEQHAAGSVYSQPATKHVQAADASTNHSIIGLSVIGWVAPVCDVCAHRIAVLNSVEASARLNRGVKIRGRQRKTVWKCPGGSSRQTKQVCRVRLLRRKQAACRPLLGSIFARKRHRTNDAVTIHNRAPHVVLQESIVLRH